MLHYENFILFPSDVAKSSPYCFEDIAYDVNLQDKVNNEKGAVVVYYSDVFDGFAELQTKGDGSCFFYATETVNSNEHLIRKLRLLKVNVVNCVKEWVYSGSEAIISDLIQFAAEKEISTDSVIMKYVNGIDCTLSLIKELPESAMTSKAQLELIKAFSDFKYNRLGFGIDLGEAVDLLKEIKQPSMLHVYPMPQWQLEKIANETQLPLDEVKGFDNWTEENSFNMEYSSKDAEVEVMHIMFRRGHFSRMIPIEKVKDLAAWCQLNKVDLIELKVN